MDYQGKLIAYTIQGTGDCLVFLHGYLEYKELWSSFIDFFKPNYQIITIDLPGHGGSDNIRITHSMVEMAQVVKFVTDKNGIDKFTLIGHSMGGYIALSFLDNFPNKLNGIILFSSSSLNDSTEKKIARNRDIELVLANKKNIVANNNIPNMFAPQNLVKFNSLIEKIKEHVIRMSNSGIIAALQGMKERVNYQYLLQNSTIPILFIAGRFDNLIQIDVSERQVKGSKNLSFKVLENSGHMGYIEEEELSAKYIFEFIEYNFKKQK